MNTADRPRSIAFIDLAEQRARIRQGLGAAIVRVLDQACYIMRQTRFRGLERVRPAFIFALAAYNLVRTPKLVAKTA